MVKATRKDGQKGSLRKWNAESIESSSASKNTRAQNRSKKK